MIENDKSAQNQAFSSVYIGKEDTKNIDKMVGNVVELLVSRDMTVSFAESCTGGLLGELITSVSGASQVFEMGLCAYANRIKSRFLGVPTKELEDFGAVSPQVSISMAKGIRRLSGADIGISVTGIAGPTGGTREKPVGTVYVGYSYGECTGSVLLRLWELDDRSRRSIRLNTAAFVFKGIEKILQD